MSRWLGALTNIAAIYITVDVLRKERLAEGTRYPVDGLCTTQVASSWGIVAGAEDLPTKLFVVWNHHCFLEEDHTITESVILQLPSYVAWSLRSARHQECAYWCQRRI